MRTQSFCFKTIAGLLLFLAGGLFLARCGSKPDPGDTHIAPDRWDSLVTVYQTTNKRLQHVIDKHTATYLLEALPLAKGSEARVFYNVRSYAVYLLVDSLPEPDPDEAYILWYFDADDVPTRLGGMNMDQPNELQPFGRVEDPVIFAISREKLPLPHTPSPERIQCAVRLPDYRR